MPIHLKKRKWNCPTRWGFPWRKLVSGLRISGKSTTAWLLDSLAPCVQFMHRNSIFHFKKILYFFLFATCAQPPQGFCSDLCTKLNRRSVFILFFPTSLGTFVTFWNKGKCSIHAVSARYFKNQIWGESISDIRGTRGPCQRIKSTFEKDKPVVLR